MAQTQFEIVEPIFRLPADEAAMYRKELNLIRWFGKEPKIDIRGWNEDHTKMTKGISLTVEEFEALITAGQEYLGCR